MLADIRVQEEMWRLGREAERGVKLVVAPSGRPASS
jgi:hypothetical protein